MKSIHILVLAGLLIPMATMPMQQSGNTAKKSQNTKKNVKSAKKSESERSNRKKSNIINRQFINAQLYFYYLTFAGAFLGQIYSYAKPHSSIAKFGSEGAFMDIMHLSSLGGLIACIGWAFDETANAIRSICSSEDEENE